MLSLKEFEHRYTGKVVDVEDGWGYPGECVSLVQRYLHECFGLENVARGDAYAYGDNLISRGEGYAVLSPRYGDIIVWQDEDYGHVGIYLGNDLVLDQSNQTRKTVCRRPFVDLEIKHYVRIKGELKKDVVKSIKALAEEVIQGLWGNGNERVQRLTNAGYDYDNVQDMVNSMLNTNFKKSTYELAQEVIRGEWGNGNERYERLTRAGYDYDSIQDKVNEILGE